MKMLDVFIEKYRWYIGVVLIVTIAIGLGIIWQDKIKKANIRQKQDRVVELTKQNDELRKQLSQQSSGQVAGEETEEVSDKININTADEIELDKLPGIGPARAADIIAYRESHGGFQSIEELKNIKGIGDKTFENLKDLVTIGETLKN